MKVNYFFQLLLVASLFLSGCEGDEGPTGPKGDKGDSGTQGAKGDTGTANVIYSDWMSFPTAAAATKVRKNFSFPAPKITQDIIDSGHVYGYIKHSSGGVHPLPYANTLTYTASGEQAGSYLNTILIGVGSISFNQDWLTPGTVPTVFADANTVVGSYTNFRYIIIPGGQKARVAGLDYSDYEAVKKFYNLPE